jgi:GDP-L-fucose synthase
LPVNNTSYQISINESVRKDISRGWHGACRIGNCEGAYKKGFTNIIATYHTRNPVSCFNAADLEAGACKFIKIDLLDPFAVVKMFKDEAPVYVFLAAARVGGIMANHTYRAQFIYENLQIQNNIIHNSYLSGIKKLIF